MSLVPHDMPLKSHILKQQGKSAYLSHESAPVVPLFQLSQVYIE